MRNAPALHGRDHCPGGSDPIPCLSSGNSSEYAWLECTTQPTADGNSGSLPTPVPWDVFSTSNQDVFDMGGAGSTTLQCKAAGAYWFEVKAEFFDVGAKVAAIPFGTIFSWIDGTAGVWFATNNFITNTRPDGSEAGIRDFATGYLNPSGTFAGAKTVGVEMWNFDGVDHDMNDCYLKAVYVPGTANLVNIF